MNGRAIAALLVVALTAGGGADWRQFRGTDNNSAIDDAGLPTSWDETDGTNVAWKIDLPGRGVSSPIVVDGHVIITADSGVRRDRLHVLSFDQKTGKKDWERQFWATGRTFCHPTSAVAAPTPASDGKHIFAFYSSNDLACLDLEGNLLWYRGLGHDFPHAGNDVGMSSSPVVVGDTVVVQSEAQGTSFAAGLDVATGETRWQVDRPKGANWASPSVWRGGEDGEDLVILQSSQALTAHRPLTGEVVWTLEGGCDSIVSSAAADGVVYVPSNGLIAAVPQGSGGTVDVVWQEIKLGPGNASPIVHGDRVYVVGGGGVLVCGDAKTGEVLFEQRLGAEDSTFWGTPLLAGGHVYCVSAGGEATVVSVEDDEPEVVARMQLGEAVLASPAAADGSLFVRSDAHLWSFSSKE